MTAPIRAGALTQDRVDAAIQETFRLARAAGKDAAEAWREAQEAGSRAAREILKAHGGYP